MHIVAMPLAAGGDAEQARSTFVLVNSRGRHREPRTFVKVLQARRGELSVAHTALAEVGFHVGGFCASLSTLMGSDRPRLAEHVAAAASTRAGLMRAEEVVRRGRELGLRGAGKVDTLRHRLAAALAASETEENDTKRQRKAR
jgi:hypothetical protein